MWFKLDHFLGIRTLDDTYFIHSNQVTSSWTYTLPQFLAIQTTGENSPKERKFHDILFSKYSFRDDYIIVQTQSHDRSLSNERVWLVGGDVLGTSLMAPKRNYNFHFLWWCFLRRNLQFSWWMKCKQWLGVPLSIGGKSYLVQGVKQSFRSRQMVRSALCFAFFPLRCDCFHF